MKHRRTQPHSRTAFVRTTVAGDDRQGGGTQVKTCISNDDVFVLHIYFEHIQEYFEGPNSLNIHDLLIGDPRDLSIISLAVTKQASVFGHSPLSPYSESKTGSQTAKQRPRFALQMHQPAGKHYVDIIRPYSRLVASTPIHHLVVMI